MRIPVAEGLFEHYSGKTAHGVIRYGTDPVVAVLDSTIAGRTIVSCRGFAAISVRSPIALLRP